MIVRKRILTSRPNNILDYDLDYSHTLFPQFGFYVFENDRVYNLVNEESYVSFGTGAYVNSDNSGSYIGYNGANSVYVRLPVPSGSGQFWNVSALASQTFDYDSSDNSVFALTNSSNQIGLWLYADWYSNSLRLASWAGSYKYSANGSIPDGENTVVGLVAEAKSSGQNEVWHYINGVQTLASAANYNKFEDTTRLYFGNRSTSHAGGANGKQYWVYLDNTRLLSAYEMKSLSDNIWQLFVPRPKIFYSSKGISFRPAWISNNQLIGGGITA